MDEYMGIPRGSDSEAAWRIGTNRILAIQRCDEGFDYTLYDEGYAEIDGGVLESPELSMTEARVEVMKLHGLTERSVEPLNYETVMEEVFEVEEQAGVVSDYDPDRCLTELNTQLYHKMFAEQEAFRHELLTMPPEEILRHAYEYIAREDILLSLEYSDLSAKQAKALLQTNNPLADIYAKWEKRETDHMTDIWDTVENRANEVLRQNFLASQRESR